ncbi:hypothetical protein LINPERHAP1_LOCUS22451 [Linum perenne]
MMREELMPTSSRTGTQYALPEVFGGFCFAVALCGWPTFLQVG